VRLEAIAGGCAEEPLAGCEEGARDRQLEQIELPCGCKRDRGRRRDALVMALRDLVRRHERLEERIFLVWMRVPRAPVP
jgi:hypothetical protein